MRKSENGYDARSRMAAGPDRSEISMTPSTPRALAIGCSERRRRSSDSFTVGTARTDWEAGAPEAGWSGTGDLEQGRNALSRQSVSSRPQDARERSSEAPENYASFGTGLGRPEAEGINERLTFCSSLMFAR